MRKNLAILTGLVALALVVQNSGVLAGGAACGDMSKAGASKSGASKASAGAACCAGDKAMKASAEGAACTMSSNCCPFDKASFEKQAPGTSMDVQTSASGATLIITAASAQYVAAVQTMAAASFESMKTQLAAVKATCTSSSSMKSGGACPEHGDMSKAGMSKASMSSGACPMTGKTSTASAGSGCCAGDKAGMKADKASGACPMGGGMTGASMSGLCETVKSGLCCADCAFEKTANGVRISWTSPKADIVKSVQTAASHMKTCLAGSARL